MPIEIHQPSESAHLVQGGGVIAVGGDGQTVTAAQLLAVGKGHGGHAIGVASEGINVAGASNSIVGAESSAVDLDGGQGPLPKYGHHATGKIRWDDQPRLPWRVMRNSAGYCASTPPDTAFEYGFKVDPGAAVIALIMGRDNPGAALANISGDMCEWRDGTLYLPVIVDNLRWGIPLVHLGAEP